MIRVASSFIAVCLCLLSTIRAQADSIVTVPLASPVYISLEADPVVRFTNGITDVRIIDFTPNLGQEFILFEAVAPSFSGPMPATGFRFTIGARARDGLASITGNFPPSSDPTFTNAVPTGFTVGTTDLLLFDLVIAGGNVPFSITLTDVDGDGHPANFATPVPEPTALALALTAALAVVGMAYRSRNKHNRTRDTISRK